jgi:hypothetical protein
MATNLYCYKALQRPSTQIRLLKVYASRDKDSAVRTRLSVHDIPLADASLTKRLWSHVGLPTYYAISYVWGAGPEATMTKAIIMNRASWFVTVNVYEALHYLRSYATIPRYYWIDCLCINQIDDAEKSHQIPLIPRLYSLAGVTVV